jgi:drug/metabolite transporter (DMT)-like permease
MISPRENLGLILGLLGMLLFAGTLPAMQLAIPALDPWFLAMARPGFAGLLAIMMIARRPLPPRSTWLPFALVTLFLVFGFTIGTSLAMATVPASHGGVVLGVLPLATAMAAAVFTHERPSLGFWIASLAGAGLVVAFALRNGGAGSLVAGDLLLVAGVASAAIGYVQAGRLSLTMPGWEVIAWALVLALPISLPLTILLWPMDPTLVPASAWAGLFYIVVITQLIAFFVWNAGLALGGIARVGQMQLLQPFCTLAIAAWVNREVIGVETILFAAAVVGTVAIGQRTRIGIKVTEPPGA